MQYRLNSLLRGAFLGLLPAAGILVLAPSAATAQDSEARESLDEVVVTARRREESLQDVPIAVSVFNGEQLAQLGAPDLTYLNQTVPNITLERSRSTNSTLSAFIRGVGQQDPVAGFEGGVGIYLDDVYLNRPQGAVLDIYDVERIEVLRGPQGTLYGRNTIGGAVKYVTRRLGDEAEAKLRLSAGSHGQLDAIGTFALPVTDNVRIGGSVARLTRDGFGDNLEQPGVENYNKDVIGSRISLEWLPSEQLFVRVSGDYTRDESDPRQGHRLLDGQFTPGAFPILDDVFDTRANLSIPEAEVTDLGVTGLVEWYLTDRVTLKNIIAYRDSESGQVIDFDSLPVSDMESPFITEDIQFSEELQFIYSGENVDAIAGFYYLDANASNFFDVILGQLGDLIGAPGLNAFTFGDVDTETWSVFGDVTFDLASMFGLEGSNVDALELSVGGRFTEDERRADVLRQTLVGGHSSFFGGNAIVIDTTSDFNGSADFSDFTPRISLAWRPNPQHNLYISFNQGFKGGGFDPRGQTSAAPDLNNDGTIDADEIRAFMKFEPEEITTYEIGAKSTWLDRRINTGLTFFVSDYTDVQIPGSIGVDTDGDGRSDTFAGVTTNAAEASAVGIEFESSATFSDSLSGSLAVGWIDAEFDEYFIAVTDPVTMLTSLQDVSNLRNIQNTPELTANVMLNYSRPLQLFGKAGEFSFVNSLSYRDDSSQFEVTSPIDQEAYTLYDASLVWTSDDERLRLGIHGKNLTDEEYKVAGYDFIALGLGLEGTLTAFYGDPLTVTATAEFRF